MLFIKKILPVDKTEWMFFGLQRSGHHAIISWILKNQEYTHFNICQCKNHLICSDDVCGTGKYVASFEGIIPDYDWQSVSANKCLVIRSPYNMYASRLAMKRSSIYHNLMFWHQCLDPHEWTQYAKEFLCQTKILGQCTKIVYDYWFSSSSYREKLVRSIGLTSASLIQEVSPFGGGSSFDGLHCNATQMDVLNRWRSFESDNEFRSILNNQEIRQYWEEICTFCTDVDTLDV